MPATPELTAVERDKVEIDPNFDFRELSKLTFDEIPPNVMAMFKWCGVYSQLQKGFFMIRLVTPGGLMTTEQFSRAIDLADQYAQGELCITTRQTLQFHWVRLQDIHRVIEGMAEVGITTKNGCGDVTRNTVTCSLQGVCPHEIGEGVRRLIFAIATDPEIRDRQRNLPRKHKISVAGCGRACAQTLMNCQGWVPTRRQVDGSGEFGWIFHAGGGLGARPYLGKIVFAWVPQDLALDVARVTVEAFNRHGDRRKRAFARLKIIIDRMGPRAFGELLLGLLKERHIQGIERIEFPESHTPGIAPSFLDGQGAITQRQDGFSVVRVMVERSEIPTRVGRALARLADDYGSGEIMFTNRQNVEIRHVPTARVPDLLGELHALGLRTEGHERLPDIVACVGSTQCKMAVTDTPATSRLLLAELGEDRAFWEDVGPLRINMNGCPNNCAHAWIADIGLRGRRRRGEDGRNVEGFSIFLGGKLSEGGRIGEHLLDVDTPALPGVIRSLLGRYLRERHDKSETFCRYMERVGVESIRENVGTSDVS